MVVKARLEFKLLSRAKLADDHLLTLNLKNVGRSILKNLVVQLHSPDPRSSVDCTGCFIHALMPSADKNVKFRFFGSGAGLLFGCRICERRHGFFHKIACYGGSDNRLR